MAFPTKPTTANGRIANKIQTGTASVKVFPTWDSITMNPGELILAIAVCYQSSAASASSWTEGFVTAGVSAVASNVAVVVGYKWATGSEVGTNAPQVSVGGTLVGDCEMFLMSIQGAHSSQAPAVGNTNVYTSSAGQAPTLTAPWGIDDNLWIAVGQNGETGTAGSFAGISSAPSPYTDLNGPGISQDAVGGLEVGVAFQQLRTSSAASNAWGMDLSNARNSATVIAIRPGPILSAPPVANAGPDQSVASGATVSLDGTGSTDDVGISSYLWSQIGGTAVTLSNTGVASPSFTAPTVGSSTALTFQLTVTDADGQTNTDTVVVTVNPLTTPFAGWGVPI